MIRGKDDSVSDVWLNRTGIWRRLFLRRMGRSLPGFLFYYVGNIACDISGITRKSTAENLIGAADFLIKRSGIFPLLHKFDAILYLFFR